jgi:hypothetical protein
MKVEVTEKGGRDEGEGIELVDGADYCLVPSAAVGFLGMTPVL